MVNSASILCGAVAAAMGVAAATTVFAGTAAAMPTDRGECNLSDLTTTVTDHGPGAGAHAYVLTLAAYRGVSCRIGGSPQLTEFLSADGRVAAVHTVSANPASWPQVTIDATHSAQIEIKTANRPGMPVTSLRFHIPSGGENTITTIPWTPGSIADQAEFGVAQSVPSHH